MIFHDPADPQVSVAHSRRFVSLASCAILHEVPEAGHNRILHNAQIVSQIIDFIAKDKREILETSLS